MFQQFLLGFVDASGGNWCSSKKINETLNLTPPEEITFFYGTLDCPEIYKEMHLKDEADKVCVYYNYGIDRKIHSRNTDAHGK